MPPQNQYPQQPQPVFDPTQPIQKPKKHFNMLIIPLVLAILLLLGAISFGFWAYGERTDYKNNVDSKVKAAVNTAVEENTKVKEAEFAEREKDPLKEYKGPAAFGSVDIKYPKTWSAFITETDKGSAPVDGYFHPDFVPGLQSGTAFALRLQVTSVAYPDELKKFDGDAKQGKVKVTTMAAEKVPTVAGVRIDGEIENGKKGSLVMFPLRDKTLKISSETGQFSNDFNDIILKNLVFSP